MRRVFAFLLAAILLILPAFAAEWPEGLSPAKPYVGVRERDLSTTIGYIMLYPRAQLPARHFCDALEIYLPREDVEANAGYMALYTADGVEVCKVDCGDQTAVTVRPLTEEELEGLLWGSGVCVEIRLPVSLLLEQEYYVFLEEGCISAANGTLPSPAITEPRAWRPIVTGEFGVSGLYYMKPQEATDASPEAEPSEPIETAAPEVILPEPAPVEGDSIYFDLVMGGEAAAAVIYSENDSVDFEEIEYTESATVTGTVTQLPLRWGVVFLSETGEVLAQVDLSR